MGRIQRFQVKYLIDEALFIQAFPPTFLFFIWLQTKARWQKTQKDSFGQNIGHLGRNFSESRNSQIQEETRPLRTEWKIKAESTSEDHLAGEEEASKMVGEGEMIPKGLTFQEGRTD